MWGALGNGGGEEEQQPNWATEAGGAVTSHEPEVVFTQRIEDIWGMPDTSGYTRSGCFLCQDDSWV